VSYTQKRNAYKSVDINAKARKKGRYWYHIIHILCLKTQRMMLTKCLTYFTLEALLNGTRAIGAWCLCLSIWHIMKGSSSYSTYEREESIKTKALKWSRGWKIKLELDNTLGRNPTLQKQKNAKAAPKQTHTLVSALKMLLPSPFYSSLLSHSPPH
jgi:hypothetical protein